MNVLNFFIGFYGKLHDYKHIPFWILTPFRKIVRNAAFFFVPRYLKKNQKRKDSIKSDVIVSFTSFPARIDNVWQVVVCMLNQEVQPRAILLWLSKEQFPCANSIPESLKRLEGDIFKIRLVEGDIRSHKKYFYVSEELPESRILLIDDDLYYPTNMIKRMLKEMELTGNMVSMYASHINYKIDNTLMPFSTWRNEYGKSNSEKLFFGSGGGFLFRPMDMYKDINNIDLALSLCPTADDIWLNAMVRLNNKKVSKIKSGLILPVKEQVNGNRLCDINVNGQGNDLQLEAINNYYLKQQGRKVF